MELGASSTGDLPLDNMIDIESNRMSDSIAGRFELLTDNNSVLALIDYQAMMVEDIFSRWSKGRVISDDFRSNNVNSVATWQSLTEKSMVLDYKDCRRSRCHWDSQRV